MAAAYAIYYGLQGLSDIGGRIHALAKVAHRELTNHSYSVINQSFYNTLTISVDSAQDIQQ